VKARRWKARIAGTLVASMSVLLCAATAEVILRLLGHHGAPQSAIGQTYPVDDPILDWRGLVQAHSGLPTTSSGLEMFQ